MRSIGTRSSSLNTDERRTMLATTSSSAKPAEKLRAMPALSRADSSSSSESACRRSSCADVTSTSICFITRRPYIEVATTTAIVAMTDTASVADDDALAVCEPLAFASTLRKTTPTLVKTATSTINTIVDASAYDTMGVSTTASRELHKPNVSGEKRRPAMKRIAVRRRRNSSIFSAAISRRRRALIPATRALTQRRPSVRAATNQSMAPEKTPTNDVTAPSQPYADPTATNSTL